MTDLPAGDPTAGGAADAAAANLGAGDLAVLASFGEVRSVGASHRRWPSRAAAR